MLFALYGGRHACAINQLDKLTYLVTLAHGYLWKSERRTASCRVKALIEAGKVRLTASAVIGARQMGFTEAETIDVVRALTPFEFHKSMTTYADHTIWQDVYRPCTMRGDVYLKLTVVDDVLIVSFKER